MTLKLNSGFVLVSRRREPVLGEELDTFIVIQSGSDDYKPDDVVVIEKDSDMTKLENDYIVADYSIIAKYE